MTVADRIAVMREGRIEQMDPPLEIYERPRSRYVADFLGDIAIVEGTVEASTDEATTLRLADGTALQGVSGEPVTPGTTAWFAARPEKFTIAREAEAQDGPNRLAGEVWDIAYLGGLTIFKVRLDAGPFAKVSVLNSHQGEATPITWEERVVLTCRPDDALVLCA